VWSSGTFNDLLTRDRMHALCRDCVLPLKESGLVESVRKRVEFGSFYLGDDHYQDDVWLGFVRRTYREQFPGSNYRPDQVWLFISRMTTPYATVRVALVGNYYRCQGFLVSYHSEVLVDELARSIEYFEWAAKEVSRMLSKV